MQNFGFEPSDEGFADFSSALQAREDNEEVKRLAAELQAVMKEATAVGSKVVDTSVSVIEEEEGDEQDEGDDEGAESLEPQEPAE